MQRQNAVIHWRIVGILLLWISPAASAPGSPGSSSSDRTAAASLKHPQHRPGDLSQAKKACRYGSCRPPRSAKATAKHPAYRPQRKRSDATFPADVESTVAFRYAQLGTQACYRELEARHLPASVESGSYLGLDAPTRLTGPLGGVTFRNDFVTPDGRPSVYSLIDCRLVLALSDFTETLRALGITEVVYSSAYRPPPSSWPSGQQGKRHGGGLAIDLHRFKSNQLGWLQVDRDFHGSLGAKVCGQTARPPANAAALTLRKLVCQASSLRLFQSILTPNYDRPHHNHFHFELTPGVRWFMVS